MLAPLYLSCLRAEVGDKTLKAYISQTDRFLFSCNRFVHQRPKRTCSLRGLAQCAWLAVCLSCTWLSSQAVFAQAGLRESLERLDRNENGEIDPDEITPLARPYLERIARSRRLSLDRSNDISEYQEAARIYHAMQNGVAGTRVRSNSESTIKAFRPDDNQQLIPEFGLAEVKYAYIQDDVDEADRTLRRYDRNSDGYIDRREAERSEWTHNDPFEMDLNGDDRLSRMELTQRYARRRLLSNDSEELVQKARRTGNGIEPSRGNDRDRDRDRDSQWWRQGGTSHWLAASVLGRFDSNRNGRLELSEAQELGVAPGRIDIDRDGTLTRDELQAYLAEVQEAAGGDDEALPGWFYELDVDRDGQVSMVEFSDDWSPEKFEEFSRLDHNQDGLLTAVEITRSRALVGGSYSNLNAEPLPPRKTVISEIVIDEDFLIGDLNVQISITHSNTGYLDCYLTGPAGQRVELFTEVGGSGDHFDETIFDDQADYPIVKARAPFDNEYQPEALSKREPSLSQFNDTNARGVWQLIVRGTRSDRFGMLHSWSLLMRPQEILLPSSDSQIADTLSELLSSELDNQSLRQSTERSANASVPDDRSSEESEAPRKALVYDKSPQWLESDPEKVKAALREKVANKQISEEDMAKYQRWLEEKKASKKEAKRSE